MAQAVERVGCIVFAAPPHGTLTNSSATYNAEITIMLVLMKGMNMCNNVVLIGDHTPEEKIQKYAKKDLCLLNFLQATDKRGREYRKKNGIKVSIGTAS